MPFELVVREGMILDLHGHPLDRWIEGRSLRHGPREHDAAPFEPEIIMERGRAVLLYDERQSSRTRSALRCHLAFGLRGDVEATLPSVFAERRASS